MNIIPTELRDAIKEAMKDEGQSNQATEQFIKFLSNYVTNNFHKDDLVDLIDSLELK